MIDIQNKANCSGCSACAAACPTGAITMQADGEGFLYPHIDKDTCVNCGLCDKMCQAISPIRAERHPAAYACWNQDDAVRERSSSGGIFHAIAAWILSQNGVVFGPAFDENLMIRHIQVETVEQLPLLQGSKYLQSAIGSTYVEAKKLLDAGRYVLFTGTPCQIDGLLHYLRKDYPKLYTQDIVCHGVPSPNVWEEYLNYQTKNFNAPLSREPLPSFRSKEEGWKRYSMSLRFGRDIEYRRYHWDDCYMQAFLKNLSLRPSCYACHSKAKKRNSDLTLADFWGIETVLPELYDGKGTSLVLANTEKGKQLFDILKEKLVWREVDFEEAVAHNTPAFQSVNRPKNREAFFASLHTVPFDKLVKKLTTEPLIKRTIRKAKNYFFAACRKCGLIGRKKS